jgi:predicted AAA+ superfamily ATPase
MMLQMLAELPIQESIYLTLDDLYFTENKLSDLVEEFVMQGGKYLYLDEVHKYPNWSIELKNIYDFHTELKILVSGSSILEIYKGNADLSRRMMLYKMPTMSFREYLKLSENLDFPAYSLEEILANHIDISNEINQKFRPVKHFKEYLKYGAYPFFIESKELVYIKLDNVINTIIENDIQLIEKFSYETVLKAKKLLAIIAESVPFKPNIAKLAEKMKTNRETVLKMINILERAELINTIYEDKKGITKLSKPAKIYLNNPTLSYSLSAKTPELGNLRETFFLNQLKYKHHVAAPDRADFIVDEKYTFEVGGKSKTKNQIQGIDNAFVVSDDIEYGFGNKIPLWLFGFLY